jgi:hypothetical protein
MNQPIYQVGARLPDGTTGIWHTPAESHIEAAQIISGEIINNDPTALPSVVLVCITGDKT